MLIEISAEEARQYTKAANFGPEDAARMVFGIIRSRSIQGYSSASVKFDREIVSCEELRISLAQIRGQGFDAKIKESEDLLRIEVSW